MTYFLLNYYMKIVKLNALKIYKMISYQIKR